MNAQTLVEANSKQTIDQDADEATDIILAGLGTVHPFVRDKVRQAYLLGRVHQAADNVDTFIKRMREQAG